MDFEIPRNMGNRDYEKKLELSNNELEIAVREVFFDQFGPLVNFSILGLYYREELLQ